ncbi:nitroreductase family protein [Mongoliitalea daihaiensis]|jgi:nitroreductase|uniref:nitroreductase family protein n=1 Tax=Mongoliitalea daihaiensis TaxID=2782006 RepID=UPI001F3060BD|nr:nitroreductase family protein [Mongoliitalea daihaiensis]UJP64515.1 nitroreductase family protein [Mongoliitalea daihaiensis]
MTLYDIKIKVQNNILLPIVRKHKKLADLYFFLFSSEFSREHQKVLQGKYKIVTALKQQKAHAFHLRRQVHRIEKGLIMKNRRPSFARDYITDTVNYYELLAKDIHSNPEADKDFLLWAYSVLKAYFDAVTHDDFIQPLCDRFEKFPHPYQLEIEAPTSAPYKHKDIVNSGITYDAFLNLAKQRRSVRYYLDKEVPFELIQKAMVAGAYAPSACNRQPFYYHVFTEQEKKDKVGELPPGIRPFFKNIPVIMVLVGRLSAYISERDRHTIYLDGGLASMGFILALETLGLSSLTINWPDIEFYENKMDALIPLADDERPLMLIGVGYADPEGGIPYSQKKSPDLLIKLNETKL